MTILMKKILTTAFIFFFAGIACSDVQRQFHNNLDTEVLVKSQNNISIGACDSNNMRSGETIYFNGMSSGKQICWTSKDLYVFDKNGGHSYFSEYFDRWFKSVAESGGRYEIDFKVDAIIGPYVFLSVEETISPTDGRGVVDTFNYLLVSDIRKNGSLLPNEDASNNPTSAANVSLQEIFPQDVLLKGLVATSEVHTNLSKTNRQPTSLSNLLATGLTFREPAFHLDDHSMYSFRFLQIHNNEVQIGVQLTEYYNTHQGKPEMLKFWIPIKSTSDIKGFQEIVKDWDRRNPEIHISKASTKFIMEK